MTLKMGEMLIVTLEVLIDEKWEKVIFRECYKLLNMDRVLLYEKVILLHNLNC